MTRWLSGRPALGDRASCGDRLVPPRWSKSSNTETFELFRHLHATTSATHRPAARIQMSASPPNRADARRRPLRARTASAKAVTSSAGLIAARVRLLGSLADSSRSRLLEGLNTLRYRRPSHPRCQKAVERVGEVMADRGHTAALGLRTGAVALGAAACQRVPPPPSARRTSSTPAGGCHTGRTTGLQRADVFGKPE